MNRPHSSLLIVAMCCLLAVSCSPCEGSHFDPSPSRQEMLPSHYRGAEEGCSDCQTLSDGSSACIPRPCVSTLNILCVSDVLCYEM